MTSIPRNTNWGTAAETIEQLVDTALAAAVIEANTYTDDAVQAVTGLVPETITALNNWAAEGVTANDANIAGAVNNPASATRAALTLSGAKPVGQGEIVLSVKDYGAVGDGSTDDTTAVNAALAAAPTNATVTFPVGTFGATGYRVTSPIVVPTGVNVDMQAPLIYAGAAGQTALTIGPSSSPGQHRARHRIWVKRSALSDWTNTADVGVHIRNHSYSTIHIVEINGFTRGLLLAGRGSAGFVYNEVTLGELRDNRYSVVITQSANGWANENNFYGGSFTVATATHTTLSRTGVLITSDDSTYINQNNNVFHKPSFEIKGGTNPDPQHGVCMVVEHGSQNHVKEARHESPSVVALVTKNASANNTFTLGFNLEGSTLPTFSDEGSAPSSVFRRGSMAAIEASTFTVRDVRNIHKAAVPYDGSGNINIPGVTLVSSTVGDSLALGSITINARYLEFPNNRAVGVYMDTTNVKRFTVFVDAEPGYGGRVIVRAYDSSGANLGSTGGPYVTGIGAWTSSWGGAYRTGSDTNLPRFFTVTSDVAYVFVGIGGGSNAVRLRGFRIATPDPEYAATWIAYPHNEYEALATQAPASGTYQAGRRVWNATPTASGVPGWVCVSGGSPGTWVAMANLASS